MLLRINRFLNKIMPIITPTSVLIGIIFADFFSPYTYLVPWIFAAITFIGSLGSNFTSFKQVLSHPLPIFIAMIVLHIVMPLVALATGHIVFPGDIYTITGLTLIMVIPTGVTSLLWVSIYKGNLPLALSIVLIDTFLSPFIVPYSLSLLFGQHVEMEVWGMMKGLLGMVVIPSLVGMGLNEWTKGKVHTRFSPKLAPFSKVGIALVVIINSSAIAPYLRNINGKLLLTMAVVVFVCASGYMVAWGIGRLLNWKRDEGISLLFAGGMRNISAGTVLAVAYFPAPVAIPVVVGMLFQQTLASFYGYLIDKFYEQRMRPAVKASDEKM